MEVDHLNFITKRRVVLHFFSHNFLTSNTGCSETVDEFTYSVYPIDVSNCTITLNLEPYQFLWLSVDVEGVNRSSSSGIL